MRRLAAVDFATNHTFRILNRNPPLGTSHEDNGRDDTQHQSDNEQLGEYPAASGHHFTNFVKDRLREARHNPDKDDQRNPVADRYILQWKRAQKERAAGVINDFPRRHDVFEWFRPEVSDLDVGRELTRGARVALLLPGSADFVFALFGAQIAGMVPVPLPFPLGLGNPERLIGSLAAIVASAGPDLLVTVPHLAPAATRLLATAGTGRLVHSPGFLVFRAVLRTR